ncbi:hypothetical protein KGY79_10965 [Candidatus Bipolaricaulota bacterium]|nr:hypothetical protein [Candidatus Bipolaricaulota bacterium]
MQKFNFIKGHMSGNEILLLAEKGNTTEKEMVEYGVQILNRPHLGGHQIGFLEAVDNCRKIRAKIVDVTEEDFLPMCGGLTQVLGHALIQTQIDQTLDYRPEDAGKTPLVTDSGTVFISTKNPDQEFNVWTTLHPVLKSIYKKGIEQINLSGVRAVKVGDNLAINGSDLKEKYPSIKLEKFDDHTRSVIVDIQNLFLEDILEGRREVCTLPIYDLNPARNGDARVIFPNHLPTEHVEPACGTGSLLTAVAMIEEGFVSDGTDKIDIKFESGGSATSIGGPDITRIKLSISNGKIKTATFSHNFVRLLAEGELWAGN